MSRPRKRGEDRIALFPFLSVLICTIGVLTLILVSSVIGQVDEANNSTESLDKKYRQLQKDLKGKQGILADIVGKINETDALIPATIRKIQEATDTLQGYSEVTNPAGLDRYKDLTNRVWRQSQRNDETQGKVAGVSADINKTDPDGKIPREDPKGVEEISGLINRIKKAGEDINATLTGIEVNKEILSDINGTLADLKDQKESLAGVAPATQKMVDAVDQRIDDLQGEAKILEEQIQDAEKEVERLQRELEKGGFMKDGVMLPGVPLATKEMLDDANEKIGKAKETIERLIKEINVLKGDIDKKLAELKKKGKSPGGTYEGEADGVKGRFVECLANDQIIIHARNDKKQKLDVVRDRVKFREFLDGVGNRERVILLIRPSGIETFRKAKKQCERAGETPGFLTIRDDRIQLEIK